MNKLAYNPWVGAILNVIWFGLADLYIGHVLPALLKAILHLVIVAIFASITELVLRNRLWPELVSLGYVLLLGWIGYHTVRSEKPK